MPTLTLAVRRPTTFDIVRCSDSLACSNTMPCSDAASATLSPGVLTLTPR